MFGSEHGIDDAHAFDVDNHNRPFDHASVNYLNIDVDFDDHYLDNNDHHTATTTRPGARGSALGSPSPESRCFT